VKYLEQIKEKRQTFKAWQEQPHHVAPLSSDAHDCTTCGTHYEGNYCPRCGQSAKIGRYSIKNALMLFLDVWGLGNRGMFRTIRDLLLRPGYMIRDYLSGMQMAYFPPFKLFFLVTALSVVVESGFNIKGENRFKQEMDTYETEFNVHFSSDDGMGDESLDAYNGEKEKVRELAISASQSVKAFSRWAMTHQSFFQLVCLLLLTLPLYLFFRRCPAIPDMRLSECFMAMVYTSAMMTMITTAFGVMCINSFFSNSVACLAGINSLKQLTGYGFWRTLVKAVVALFLIGIFFCVVMFLLGVLIAMRSNIIS